jgi:hypothetical protein
VHDEVLFERTSLDSVQGKLDIDIAIISEVNCELSRWVSRRLHGKAIVSLRNDAGVTDG